jgi:hypothetical protein
MKNKGFEQNLMVSPAAALRHGIFNKLTPILLSSDFINDSAMRELIQENCTAVVSLLENIIEQYKLDQKITAQE